MREESNLISTRHKVLAVAFEPWETELSASVNKQLRISTGIDETKLFIADFWQLHRGGPFRNLKRIADQYDTEYFDLGEEFECWQDASQQSVDYDQKIFNWSKRNQVTVSTRVLEFSDHIFSCFERSPYYRPVTRQQRAAILYFYLRKIEKVLDDYCPTVVWTIERNYLAKNIFSELCTQRSMRMATLVYSRLGNVWYFTPEFVALPSAKITYPEVPADTPFADYSRASLSEQSDDVASSFIRDWKNGFENNKSTLYEGGTEKKLASFNDLSISRPGRMLKDIWLTSRLLARHVWIRNGDKAKMPRSYVYTGDWWRTCIYTLNQLFRRSMYEIFGLPGGVKSLPQGPFFYYPLHHRPESSTLTLGRGVTDEAAISHILRVLPHGCVLAIKENPMIIQDRPRGFYRTILDDPRITLLDPLVPTQLLIKRSLGVISVSGTALLEAALFGRPAHSVGRPEFFRFINSTGFDGVEKFLVDCVTGRAQSCEKLAETYVRSVFAIGQPLELGWQVLEPARLSETSTSISVMLLRYLDLEIIQGS